MRRKLGNCGNQDGTWNIFIDYSSFKRDLVAVIVRSLLLCFLFFVFVSFCFVLFLFHLCQIKYRAIKDNNNSKMIVFYSLNVQLPTRKT